MIARYNFALVTLAWHPRSSGFAANSAKLSEPAVDSPDRNDRPVKIVRK